MATDRPVLVDSGFGSPASYAATTAFLAADGLAPADLAALAITHFHNDHAGGAAWLRSHGVPVLLHQTEADLIAAGAPEAFDRTLLPFAVTPFGVDRRLADGDVVDAGDVQLHVVHVPSQTPGHVAFWEPRDRVLFSGDLIQAGDVGWVRFGGPWAEDALARTVAAVERLAALEPALVVPGHGPVVEDPAAAIADNLARYESWRGDPARPALHACRRIVITSLALGPSTAAQLAGDAWARLLADVLGVTPEQAVADLVALHTRAGNIIEGDDGLLHTTVPHDPRA